MRACMNSALSEFTLEKGTVVDLGGGKDPSYFQYLKGVADTTVSNIDKQHAVGSAKDIDFEKDALPYANESVDQILMLNVLEHIYHHTFFVGESLRILKKGKTVIGFVPFLINYHADPHDYFRYTDEALRMIFTDAGFSKVDIRPLGQGPFAVNFNTLASFMPRALNFVLWPSHYLLDLLFVWLKPSLRKRFPLGYLFVLTK
jgi:SAM-dependent methyltransferase